MGPKTKTKPVTKSTQIAEESDDDKGEFEINLKALDGYDLPNSEDEEEEVRTVDDKPKKKKMKKEYKPRALGIDYREREEKRLEQLLFGELLQTFEKIEAAPLPPIKKSKDNNEESTETSSGVLPADKYGNRLGIPSVTDKKAAWVDDDDLTLELKDVVAGYSNPANHGSKETSTTNYKQYLEKNFVSVHGQATPKWAQLDKDGSKKKKAGALENLTKTATDLLVKDSLLLPPTIIEVKRVTDLNKESRAEGAGIKATEFHKKQSVALVAGNSGVATLFRVGGYKNEKIQSIRFNQFPIHRAHFSADGEEFLALSNMSGNIQVHNIVTGKSRILPHNKDVEKGIFKNFVMSPDGNLIAFQGRFGYIHLMSARSKEWVSSLKTNGEVHALTFNSDGTRLYSHGEFGEVHVWDMNSRNCVHKFVDDGCIIGTSIAVSPTQQFLACGSSSGVVNLYDTSKLENCSLPKPDKILLNLVTQINGINFHPNSELMSMYSTEKKNAIRMVHFPSLTVFKNFPMAGKETPQINSLDFSPNGGYFSLGLANGSAQLYRLHHYDQY